MIFCDFEQVLSLTYRPTILTVCWNSAKRGTPKSPKIKLKIEFQRLEVNSRPISSMYTKIEQNRRHKL